MKTLTNMAVNVLHKALNLVESSGPILLFIVERELNFVFQIPQLEACYNVGCKIGQLLTNSTILIVILYDIRVCSTCF